MKQLFPKYSHLSGDNAHYIPTGVREQYCKVFDQEYFDIYFTLSIPESLFSRAEIKNIINLADTPENLKAKLVSVIDTDKKESKTKYQSLLDKLTHLPLKEIEENKIKPLLQAIYDVSDKLEDTIMSSTRYPSIKSNLMNISELLIERFNDIDRRFNLLKEIFKESESIYMVVIQVDYMDHRANRDNHHIVTLEQKEELRGLALKRIEEFADNKKLSKAARFPRIMHYWEEWGGTTEKIKQYITDLIKADEGLIEF